MTRYFIFICFCLAFCLSLSSCATEDGVDVYHWSPATNIGPGQFVRDHNACLREADSWPFDTSPSDMLNYVTPGPAEYQHRLDADDHRLWASFVPYPGAQAVYVNDPNSSGSVDAEEYSACMESLGYVQALPPENRSHLIDDRRIGYRGEY